MHCTIEATHMYFVRNTSSVTLNKLHKRATSLVAYDFIRPWGEREDPKEEDLTPKVNPATVINENSKISLQPKPTNLYEKPLPAAATGNGSRRPFLQSRSSRCRDR